MTEETIKKLAPYRFAIMIAGVALLASALTAISITVYIASGAINIDLSRPDYESVRSDVVSNENEPPFGASGPVDKSVIDDLSRRLDNIQTELSGMNDFSGESLSDEILNLR
jgi:hypothetical protein